MIRFNRQAGFTLMELMVSIALMAIVTLMLTQAYSVAVDTYRRGRIGLREGKVYESAFYERIDPEAFIGDSPAVR